MDVFFYLQNAIQITPTTTPIPTAIRFLIADVCFKIIYAKIISNTITTRRKALTFDTTSNNKAKEKSVVATHRKLLIVAIVCIRFQVYCLKKEASVLCVAASIMRSHNSYTCHDHNNKRNRMTRNSCLLIKNNRKRRRDGSNKSISSTFVTPK